VSKLLVELAEAGRRKRQRQAEASARRAARQGQRDDAFSRSHDAYAIRYSMSLLGAFALPHSLLAVFLVCFLGGGISMYFISGSSIGILMFPFAVLFLISWVVVGIQISRDRNRLASLPFSVVGYPDCLAHRRCIHGVDITFVERTPDEETLRQALWMLPFQTKLISIRGRVARIHVHHKSVSNPPITQRWLRRWFFLLIDRVLTPVHADVPVATVDATWRED
jgi:hypothetical protein